MDEAIIVTGAAGGIGRAIASALSAEHPLLLLDRDESQLRPVATELRRHARVDWRAVDLTDPGAVEHAVSDIGKVVAFVGAVGTTSPTDLTDRDLSSWDAVISSCLTSMAVSSAAALRRVDPAGAAFVLLGSPHAERAVPGFGAYAAAKAGVAALARQIALEFGPRRVRCNLVVPGWTDTTQTRSRTGVADLHALADATPLRRLTDPDDVASAVAFLCSDAAKGISGTTVVVDGGAGVVTPSAVLRPGQRAAWGLTDL